MVTFKIGQRVQESRKGTQGWVTEAGLAGGACMIVWDDGKAAKYAPAAHGNLFTILPGQDDAAAAAKAAKGVKRAKPAKKAPAKKKQAKKKAKAPAKKKAAKKAKKPAKKAAKKKLKKKRK
jgi:hypothetical protein